MLVIIIPSVCHLHSTFSVTVPSTVTEVQSLLLLQSLPICTCTVANGLVYKRWLWHALKCEIDSTSAYSHTQSMPYFVYGCGIFMRVTAKARCSVPVRVPLFRISQKLLVALFAEIHKRVNISFLPTAKGTL